MLERVEPVVTLFARRARDAESRYDWLGAAQFYGKEVRLPEEHSSQRSVTYEQLAYALFRASFQSDEPDKFRDVIRQAIEVAGLLVRPAHSRWRPNRRWDRCSPEKTRWATPNSTSGPVSPITKAEKAASMSA